jgi:hypothetical protein
MSEVISGWFFEPLPEAMRIVLPVQVLRTDKPLPAHAALVAPRDQPGTPPGFQAALPSPDQP